MSNRELFIELKDGRNAVIRGFIRNRDRSMYRRLMLEGQTMSTKEMEASDGEVDVDLSRVMGASDKLIEKLLLEYCGSREQPFEALMDSEFGDDYEAISNKVMEVFGRERELPKE